MKIISYIIYIFHIYSIYIPYITHPNFSLAFTGGPVGCLLQDEGPGKLSAGALQLNQATRLRKDGIADRSLYYILYKLFSGIEY